MPEPRDISNSERTLTKVIVEFDRDLIPELEELSVVEVTMVESLLTPGLQTSIKFQNFHQYSRDGKVKSLEKFKGAACRITIERPILDDAGMQHTLIFAQRVYRLEKRGLINYNNEEFTLHLCDDTLLNDAKNLVSKSWVCTTPTDVVEHVLRNCVNAKTVETEPSSPARDYIAENIHPFQVVTQQEDVALAAGNDPSFFHFMTYRNFNGFDCRGTHHFESLHRMAKKPTILTLLDSEASTVGKYSSFAKASDGNGRSVNAIPMLTYSFPADFDLLQDILNGVEGDGNSLIAINPYKGQFSLFGNKTRGCGVGGYNAKESQTNQGSTAVGCPVPADQYLLKRQARVGLLDDEDVAFRTTVPWVPQLHVGETINVLLRNKNSEGIEYNYGSGKYLISAMVHNVKNGGYSTTTLDCVSETVSRGEL